MAKECNFLFSNVSLILPQWTFLRQRLIEEIDPEEDSLRFYFLAPTGSTELSMLEQKKGLTKRGRWRKRPKFC